LVRYFEDQKFIAKGSLCGKQKNLFWHVDYLLDHLDAEIKSVYIIYGHRQIETTLASWLEIQPQTCVIDKGLGASDDPGRTHLLFVDANEGWWQDLSHTIINLINIAGEKRNSHVERE
jgi:Uri superfamily endonuclease